MSLDLGQLTLVLAFAMASCLRLRRPGYTPSMGQGQAFMPPVHQAYCLWCPVNGCEEGYCGMNLDDPGDYEALTSKDSPGQL